MPDGRLRGATAYSTNKSTLANRRRIANLDPVQKAERRKRISEYQAIWQLLQRVSRKSSYQRATRTAQRTMLQGSLTTLMNKRRREGKAMCRTDEADMIERHLKKEAKARRIANGKSHSTNLNDLKGVAEDPQPHDPEDMRSDSGFSEGDYDDAQEGIDHEFDMHLLKAEEENLQLEGVVEVDRVLHDEHMHKDRTMSKSYQIKALISTVRALETRIKNLEAKDSDRDGTSNGSYYGDYPDDSFYQNGFGSANDGDDGQQFQDGMIGANGHFPMNPYGTAIYPPMWSATQPQQDLFDDSAEYGQNCGDSDQIKQDAQRFAQRDEVRTPEHNQGQPQWVEV